MKVANVKNLLDAAAQLRRFRPDAPVYVRDPLGDTHDAYALEIDPETGALIVAMQPLEPEG